MKHHLDDKEKFLDSVDLAPATPEADFIRAAVTARLRLPPDWLYIDRGLVEADIIDEQHLRARLQALEYGDLAECSDESLKTIIVQRAIAFNEQIWAEIQNRREPPHEEAIATLQSRITLLRSLRPGDRFSGCSYDMKSRSLWFAWLLTGEQIHRFERLLGEMISIIDEIHDDDGPDDDGQVVDSRPPVGDIAFRLWKDDEHMRAKYRNSFRDYLRDKFKQ